MKDIIKEKIGLAEKRIGELDKKEDLKKLSEVESYKISSFYEEKSKNRLQTAKIIYDASRDGKGYKDYAEVVASAYYSMYYIVHAYLSLKYKKKIREHVRGVHSITQDLILYFLVKTEKLARHLYEEYLKTYEATAQIQKLSLDDFQEKAFEYVKKYDKTRSAREIFTYNVTPGVEEYNAKQAIDSAEEFINTIKQMML